jgi:hypothetical protein
MINLGQVGILWVEDNPADAELAVRAFSDAAHRLRCNKSRRTNTRRWGRTFIPPPPSQYGCPTPPQAPSRSVFLSW